MTQDTWVHWFGQHWGAPCCDLTSAGPTPTGEPCCLCQQPIRAGDNGFLVLYFGFREPAHTRPVHYACEVQHITDPKPNKPDKPDKPK
jgi:hypothetical protein